MKMYEVDDIAWRDSGTEVDNFISRLFPGRTWAGLIRLARTKGGNIDICGEAER